MALAPLIYSLWNRVMRFDPQDPIWPNRDRFVLSNGHASMLLWSVLHLTAGRRMPSFWCRTGCASSSTPGSARAVPRRAIDGKRCLPPTELATEIEQMQRRELPAGDCDLPSFSPDPKGIAGRDASGEVLNRLAQDIPWFLGGSADLGPSNKTTLKFPGAGDFEAATPGGRNLHFGVREHAMAAVVNGLSLWKLRPFGATFFIFSDYARPTIRLSALTELPTIFVFTHDAMGDGEDGPTHQPVEQLISLRAIPGLVVLSPRDANEVVEAYRYVLQLRHQPAVMALSRQPLPTLDCRNYASAAGVAQGAYVMADTPGGPPEIILIASGSEVSLIVEAHEALASQGIRSRVVSMPSWDIFEHQPQSYRESVLPPEIKVRIAVEQGSALGWDRYIGAAGRVIANGDLRRLRAVQGAAAQVWL
jgi:transketolase